MAGFLNKTMVYLGLKDDDYEYDDAYDDPQVIAPVPTQAQSTSRIPRPMAGDPPEGGGAVRTLAPAGPELGAVSIQPRSSVVRPITTEKSAKVHVVEPGGFGDAQEIGDRLKGSQPVIVSLQGADRDLVRRLVDFCSGATYVLGGSMEKVAKDVFLLTPSNVEVSAEERRRLEERGLLRRP